MSRKSPVQPLDIAFALGAGAAAALVFGVLLATFSAPNQFDDRMTALAQTADQAQTLLKPLRDPGPYGAEAICTRDASQQAQILRNLVNSRAAEASLAVDSLDARAEPEPDGRARLVPIRLRFSVTGPYEGAVGLLAILSRERPQLFVDSLDLTPKVSNVTLSMSGRVFCGA